MAIALDFAVGAGAVAGLSPEFEPDSGSELGLVSATGGSGGSATVLASSGGRGASGGDNFSGAIKVLMRFPGSTGKIGYGLGFVVSVHGHPGKFETC